MSHDKKKLRHLGKLLLQLYCSGLPGAHRLCIPVYSKKLIPAMSKRWDIDRELLPDEQMLYRAFQGDQCSTATKEKLALLRDAALNEKEAPALLHQFRLIINRQRLLATPHWDSFVEAYNKEQAAKPQYFVPPKDLDAWVKTWREKDKRPIQEAIKRNLAEGKKKKQNNNETGTIKK